MSQFAILYYYLFLAMYSSNDPLHQVHHRRMGRRYTTSTLQALVQFVVKKNLPTLR